MKRTNVSRRVANVFVGSLFVFIVFFMAGGVHTGGVAWARTTQTLTPLSPATTQQGQVLNEAYGKLPLSFEANAGQTASDVKFLSRGRGYQLYLTPTEAVMTFQSTKEKGPAGSRGDAENAERPESVGARLDAPALPQVVKMKFLGAAAHPKISGESPLPGKVNYFVGKDKSRWQTNVPTYGKVRYEGVYPGIDLVHYGTQDGQLEYDFVVAPGANPDQIALGISGGKLTIDADGSLVLNAPVGEVVRWGNPLIYQEVGGRRVPIEGGYKVKKQSSIDGPQVVSFQMATYDRRRPLIIDPLVYATDLGGSGYDYGRDIAVDGAGAAYVTGQTDSSDLPATLGAYDTTSNGFLDLFITKISAAGDALVYTTYLGGDRSDYSYGIAVDGTGAAYVTGQTESSDFPTTLGAYDTTFNGFFDLFVTKISATGNALIYSTYLGGGGDDQGHDISVDGVGAAYVTGQTDSFDFPTTLGAYDTTFGGFRDGFVTKIPVAGNRLDYSTYLGGRDGDYGRDIAVGRSGTAYVTGYTSSPDFPTMPGAADTTFNGSSDLFVTKLSATGADLIYSTYFGGGGSDQGYGIAVDGAGHAYVTGYTDSSDAPMTLGAYDTTHNGLEDAFVTKLSPTGDLFVYATYLGAERPDYGYGISVDGAGRAYATGVTASSGFPTTSGAHDTTHNGSWDVFVTKISAAGDALVYATYLGGDSADYGHGIAVDGAGAAYVTGYTVSADFPTTPGAYDTTFNGFSDVFVTKIPTPTALDIDGDGIPNGTDPDMDGDGIPNATDPDMDSDGIPNGIDLDTDGDGVPSEADTDLDGDGIANVFDNDTDGDGAPNTFDTDDDGDGAADDLDGTPNGVGTLADIDDDGIPNESDPDLDGDGIANPMDGNADGDLALNLVDTDDDGDGAADSVDDTPMGVGTPTDIDGDDIPSEADPDMDGDGIANAFDNDIDGDGALNIFDPDDDGDGLSDDADNTPNGVGTLDDVDRDGIPNRIDPDMDGDGIANAFDDDADGNGIPVCHGKEATIFGNEGNNLLKGTAGRDVIHGLGGNDTIFGGGGSDLICGGSGKDQIFGQNGKDKLYGQKGQDRLNGGKGKDLCHGGPGKDTATHCEKRKSVR